jgi:hypothetical protein
MKEVTNLLGIFSRFLFAQLAPISPGGERGLPQTQAEEYANLVGQVL